jgi:hypothetical protein
MHGQQNTKLCNTYFFPRQRRLRERASLLRYKYIACLVSFAKAVFWLNKLPTRQIPGVRAQQVQLLDPEVDK